VDVNVRAESCGWPWGEVTREERRLKEVAQVERMGYHIRSERQAVYGRKIWRMGVGR